MQGPHQAFPAWLACVVVSASIAGPVLADEPDRGQEHATDLYLAACQQLAAFVGNPCMAGGRLQGDLEVAAANSHAS
jgi:hypothetical protein